MKAFRRRVAGVAISIVLGATSGYAADLINLNFDGGPSVAKVGTAAIGNGPADFWNFYERRYVNGEFVASGTVEPLFGADGTLVGGRVEVFNAPGAWANGVEDRMYGAYVYPFDENPITIRFTGLPPGRYDLYLYGHGGPDADAANTEFEVVSGAVQYGRKATTQGPGWNTAVWKEGDQYVVFREVEVGHSVPLVIRAHAHGYHHPSVNGLQMLRHDASPSSSGIPVVQVHPRSQGVTIGDTVRLSVAAAGKEPLVYFWSHNGAILSGISAPELTLVDVTVEQAGEYRAIVANAEGHVVSEPATLEVLSEPLRLLELVGPPPTVEGRPVSIALRLIGDGVVGGGTLTIRFDPEVLTDPETTLAPILGNACTHLHRPAPGEWRLAFALPGMAVPAGDQPLAGIRFRARSIPADLITAVGLEMSDLSDATGAPLMSGTRVRGAQVSVVRRQLVGDVNGNGRLDVGDASLLMRFLVHLEELRAWDIGANDLNGSGTVDSGDVIRVLRDVVGLSGSRLSLANGGGALRTLSLLDASVPGLHGTSGWSLTLHPATAPVGGRLTVRIERENGFGPVSGLSWALRYPAQALRLVAARSVSRGAGGNAGPSTILWNSTLVPESGTPPGTVRFAVSGAGTGSLAEGNSEELEFEVLPAVASAASWPIDLQAIEYTREGYEMEASPSLRVQLHADADAPPRLNQPVRHGDGSWTLHATARAGVRCRVEFSLDLRIWSALAHGVAGPDGSLTLTVPATDGPGSRFYRVAVLEALED